MKKLLALLCVAVMLVACCLPVFAAGSGSITIQETVVDQKYSVYQLATLESFSASSYSYKPLAAWVEFFETGAGAAYFDINAAGYLEVTAEPTDEQKVALAKDALAYATAKGIGPSVTPIKATGDTVEFSGLEFGYYLVDSTLGTLCTLNTHNNNFTFKEKNAAPSIEKTTDKQTASFGEIVTYTVTVTVQKGAENYVVHDAMSAGLTFKGIKSITLEGVAVDPANYTIKTEDPTDSYDSPVHDPVKPCTFEVAFQNSYIELLAAGSEIVIVYTAVVNENAEIAGEGNPNKAYLEYGDKNEITSTPDKVVSVKVYEFSFVKTSSESEPTKYPILDTAQFKLYDAETGGNEIEVVELSAGEYRLAIDTEPGVAIKTNGGKALVSGLASGTYWLEEVVVPDGYNKLTGRVKVVIGNANVEVKGTIDANVYTKNADDIHIINNTGTVLPETGGFGTTMFLLIGGGLMLCTGILLVTKKRMDKIAD